MAPLRFAIVGRGRMARTMRALIGDVPYDEAEAIYIASRNGDHARHALAALADGKAVLCEKPFAMTLAEADRIMSRAQQARLLFMEAVATPFLPAVAFALAAAQSGRLGATRHLEASFGYPIARSTHPRLFERDGGVLADRAVYPLMLAVIALGPVTAARISVERDALGIDIAARFQLDHDGGGRSDLAVSFVERLDNSMRIAGDAAVVEVAPPLLGAQRVRLLAADSPSASRRSRRMRQHGIVRRLADIGSRVAGQWHPHGTSPYIHEIEHFTALVRSGASESPLITQARMLAVTRLVDQARAS